MNYLINILEETADAIARNPQHYLSRRRMVSIGKILRKSGLKEQAEQVQQAANGPVDNMVDLLRQIANSL